MSNVIPFPSKNKFSEQFRGKVPDQILDEMLAAYDRVVVLKDQYPSGEFRVNPEDEEKAKKVVKDYEEYGGLNDQVQHVTHQVRCCHDLLLSPSLC